MKLAMTCQAINICYLFCHHPLYLSPLPFSRRKKNTNGFSIYVKPIYVNLYLRKKFPIHFTESAVTKRAIIKSTPLQTSTAHKKEIFEVPISVIWLQLENKTSEKFLQYSVYQNELHGLYF